MESHKYLSKVKIEEYAYKFLLENSPESLNKPIQTDIEYIVENKLNINLQYLKLDSDKNLLGMTIMNPMKVKYLNENSQVIEEIFDRNTILINEFLASEKNQEHRLYFTLAHEVGHWYLQRKDAYIDSGQQSLFGQNTVKSSVNRFIDNTDIFKNLKRKKLVTKEDWLEWQANYFASCILMPKKMFKNEYIKLQNKNVFEKILILSEIFNVSEEAAVYRIKEISNELNEENESLFQNN